MLYNSYLLIGHGAIRTLIEAGPEKYSIDSLPFLDFPELLIMNLSCYNIRESGK